MDEDVFAFAAIRRALTAAFAGEKEPSMAPYGR
jgi:hypothetical protein